MREKDRLQYTREKLQDGVQRLSLLTTLAARSVCRGESQGNCATMLTHELSLENPLESTMPPYVLESRKSDSLCLTRAKVARKCFNFFELRVKRVRIKLKSFRI